MAAIHFWQVWLKSVQRFQRRRFKCEKLTDGRRTLTHDKISMICLRKARKVSVCLSDFIDMSLLYLRHVMSWCLVKYKLARNVHWMVLYQICVFGADLKSNMAARVHNVFSLAEILKIFLSETTKSIEL
jgi:hypothetical protein